MSAFIIHALPVAGGILALSPIPGRYGDYAGDMEHIHDWRPAMILSMTTMREMEDLGAGQLGPQLVAQGARWVHLPIRDFGAPDEDVQRRWPEASALALRALKGGGRVLVHCRGGCGRSGMVVLRLMIEAGEKPMEALSRLRMVRPCAVETAGQMNWATKA